MAKAKLDMQGVSVFTPGYMQSVNVNHCCASVHEEGRGCRFYQCQRDKRLLEYGGMLFCKQHHPPSIKAREDKARRCMYTGHAFGLCGAKLKKDELGVMCRECRAFHVRQVNSAKVAAYDRAMSLFADLPTPKLPFTRSVAEIGRASCRERVLRLV